MPLNDNVPSNAWDVLERNAQDLDRVVNSKASKVTLRGAPNGNSEIDTLTGLYQKFGGIPVGDYADGTVLNNIYDIAYYSTDGSYWGAASASELPITIDATTYPEPANHIPALRLFSGINTGTLGDYTDFVFDTLSDAVSSELLSIGDKVSTKGYLTEGVGAAEYIVVTAGTGTPDGGAYIDLTGITGQLELIYDGEIEIEKFGAVGDGVTDDGQKIIDALATNAVILLDSKNYATSIDIPIRSDQKLRGIVRPYLETGPRISWVGVGLPAVGVVYMANNDDRSTENLTSVSYAEFSNCIVSGESVADVGFYANYTSSGTVIKNIFGRRTLGVAILISKCFYTQVDWLSGRGNSGAGVAIGQYTQFMYSGGDAAVNGLGDVHIEGHSCGDDLAWDPVTNPDTGFGLGLFGTIHKVRFIVTLEANWGPALYENCENGEFDSYGYIESSAKNITANNPTAGEHSVHLFGSATVFDKCKLDFALRTNQRVNINPTSNVRTYFLKLDGSDSGVGLIDNGYTDYRIDPASRFNFLDDASNEVLHERVMANGTVNLNASSGFTVDFYIRPEDRGTPFLRFVQKSATGDITNFNYRIDVDGSTITTKGVNFDNKSAYEVTESVITLNDGHFLLQGTQSVGVSVEAYYEVILKEAINYEIQ